MFTNPTTPLFTLISLLFALSLSVSLVEEILTCAEAGFLLKGKVWF